MTLLPGVLHQTDTTTGFNQETTAYTIYVQAGQTTVEISAAPLNSYAKVYIDDLPAEPDRGASNTATVTINTGRA